MTCKHVVKSASSRPDKQTHESAERPINPPPPIRPFRPDPPPRARDPPTHLLQERLVLLASLRGGLRRRLQLPGMLLVQAADLSGSGLRKRASR